MLCTALGHLPYVMRFSPNWDHYCAHLPDWLVQTLRTYLHQCRRTWLPDRRDAATTQTLSRLTGFLRWAADRKSLHTLTDLDADLWLDYIDARLLGDIKPATLNNELYALRHFLHVLSDQGSRVCPRLLAQPGLPTGFSLPRDLPLADLRRLLAAIETEAASTHAGRRRTGLLDRAWFLLMLHSGLRTGEIRRLQAVC